MILKVAKSLDDIENYTITKIRYSDDKKFIGIVTSTNVILFLEAILPSAPGSVCTCISIVDYTNVPKDLLEKLNVEFGLVEKEKIKTGSIPR